MAEDSDFDEEEFFEGEVEEEEDEDIGGLARAKVIIDKRISTSTRKGYDSHIKKLVKWLKIHHADQVVTINGFERPRIPLPRDVLMQFLGDAPRLDRNGRLKAADKAPIANSTMNGIASAINDLYREAKIEMDQATRIEVTSLMRGYKRTIADEKLAGRMKVFEGKRPITFRGYAMLAKYALKSQEKDSVFAHLYIVLCWNLFSRSNSIANIMYNHIEWKEDALMITTPKHKGDQEGSKAFPKHCYADPFTPEICPVLALALHIFCTSFRPDVTDPKLFSGSSLEGKFSNWLTKALKSASLANDADLGAIADELGSHSFR
jgi:integrase